MPEVYNQNRKGKQPPLQSNGTFKKFQHEKGEKALTSCGGTATLLFLVSERGSCCTEAAPLLTPTPLSHPCTLPPSRGQFSPASALLPCRVERGWIRLEEP